MAGMDDIGSSFSWDDFADFAFGGNSSVGDSGKSSSSASAGQSSDGGGKSSASASLGSAQGDDSWWGFDIFGSGGDDGGYAGRSAAQSLSGGSDPVFSDGPSWEQFSDFVGTSEPGRSGSSGRTDAVSGSGPNWDQFVDFLDYSGAARSSGEKDKESGLFDKANDYRESRIAERAAAGVTPSPGLIDWNAIMYDLNAPFRDRVEKEGGKNFQGAIDVKGIVDALNAPYNARELAAGGKPFEGVVDFEGLMNAFTGGPSNATRDNATFLANNVPVPDYALVGPPSFDRSSVQTANVAKGNAEGFVVDPVTGAYYAPVAAPDTAWAREQMPAALQQDVQVAEKAAPRMDPIGEGLPKELLAMIETQKSAPPPAATPPVTAAAAPVTPAVFSGDRGPNAGITLSTTPPTEKEPTIWDNVVSGAGKVFEHTAAGGIVHALFPEFWDDAGQNVKDFGNNITGDPYTREDLLNFGSPYVEGEDSGWQPPYFVDANGNGIDDRYETPGGAEDEETPPTIVANGYDRNGNVLFPGIPPYRPGIDPEWLYFQKTQQLKDGGMVRGYAEGGPVAPTGGLDPRVTIIADAEDALTGEHPNPEAALQLFIKTFGEEALEQLKAQVEAGMSMRGKPRMIKGPGGPKDDMVPARIDGGQEARLSDGEFVVTADAVANAGDGDPEKGAAMLSQLDEMLQAKGRGARG